MPHSWRGRFLGRPPTQSVKPCFNSTAVQILDITREGDAAEAKRVHVEEGMQAQLPGLSEGTIARWIHLRTPEMDYDLLMNFALTHQEFSKEERASVYKLLKKFREDQQHSSNHGKYFEPACLQQTQLFEGVELVYQPQFISLPYITLGKASTLANSLLPLRRSIHPTLSLFQHHYRRESAISTAKRDSEQTCSKLAGPGSNSIVTVNNLWVLTLNKSTIITVAPADGDQLWSSLKIINHRNAQMPELDGSSLWETLDLFASRLQKKLNLTIKELEKVLQYQKRIKGAFPTFLTNMAENNSTKSEGSSSGFFGFLFLLINSEWIFKLHYRFSTLESFLAGNRARFESNKNVERSEISEEVELQSESLFLSFYENVDGYIEAFTKVYNKGTIPLLFPSNKAMLDRLWLDVKHQSQLFQWKISAMDLNTQVMAATGLSEAVQMRDMPVEVEQLVALAMEALVPEDSTETSSLKISDIYSQYIACLQSEAQKSPSKKLVKDIYQVTEELEIITRIICSQHRVVTQVSKAFQAPIPITDEGNPHAETLNNMLRRLQFLRSGLDEYQSSCSRLAALAARQQVDSRLENLVKITLVFTMVTMIFLPLLFISNLFGMNVADIREMKAGQWVFWVSALSVTFMFGLLVFVVAFFGEDLMRRLKGLARSEENYERRFNSVKES